MSAPLYALVAYVRSPVGQFVEDLRRDLHSEHPELPAHLTILPPRPLQGSEAEAQGFIRHVCQSTEPFEVAMGDVETFVPITPTVFIRVAHAAYRMRELHDRLDTGLLAYQEPWPYMPHLTIIKVLEPEAAQAAATIAQQRWEQYRGSRSIRIEELTFVREGSEPYSWIDLISVRLGDGLGG
jgi:2'-5' RNA ligase